jgi:hypothetical protein
MKTQIDSFVQNDIDLGWWHEQGVVLGVYMLDDVTSKGSWGPGNRGWNIPYKGYNPADDPLYGVPGYARPHTDDSLYDTGWGIPGWSLDETGWFVREHWPNLPTYHRMSSMIAPPVKGGYKWISGDWDQIDFSHATIANQYQHTKPTYPTRQHHSLDWHLYWGAEARKFLGFDPANTVWAMPNQHGGRANNTTWNHLPGPGWTSVTGISPGAYPAPTPLPNGKPDMPNGFPVVEPWVGGSHQGRMFMRPSEFIEVTDRIIGQPGYAMMNFRHDVDDWYGTLLYYLQRDFGTTEGKRRYDEWHDTMKQLGNKYRR